MAPCFCGAEGASSFFSCKRRAAVGWYLVGVRYILSLLGGLLGLLGLSIASKKMAQAVQTFRPPPSIWIVGPTAAGKTTLFQYLCHSPRLEEPASTVVQPRTGRIAADLSESHFLWFRSKI